MLSIISLPTILHSSMCAPEEKRDEPKPYKLVGKLTHPLDSYHILSLFQGCPHYRNNSRSQSWLSYWSFLWWEKMPCGEEQNPNINSWGPDANLCHLQQSVTQKRDLHVLLSPGRDWAPNHRTLTDQVSRSDHQELGSVNSPSLKVGRNQQHSITRQKWWIWVVVSMQKGCLYLSLDLLQIPVLYAASRIQIACQSFFFLFNCVGCEIMCPNLVGIGYVPACPLPLDP